jgi:hypothetical protein
MYKSQPKFTYTPFLYYTWYLQQSRVFFFYNLWQYSWHGMLAAAGIIATHRKLQQQLWIE